MIVDCHTHISCVTKDDPNIPERLAGEETVNKCIVLASDGQSGKEVNENLSEYIVKHNEKMVGFAFIDPTKDKISTKNITSITEKLGFKGVVLYCSGCGFHPTHSKAMRFYETAVELGLPVFFHNGGHLAPDAAINYSQPYHLDEIAAEFKDLKIIIGSMGVPFIEQTFAMVAKHENVYADLTISPKRVWQIYNTVISAYENGVMNKLLFGSGFPYGNAGECIEVLLGFNKLLGDISLPAVPRADIRGIIERDTLKLLGIEQ